MQVLEPRSCGISKVKREVADDHGVICRAAQLACQAVIVEPNRGISLARVLEKGGGLSEAWGEGSSANLLTEYTGAWRLR